MTKVLFFIEAICIYLHNAFKKEYYKWSCHAELVEVDNFKQLLENKCHTVPIAIGMSKCE